MSSMVRRQFPFALLISVTLPVFAGSVPAFAEAVVGDEDAGSCAGAAPAGARHAGCKSHADVI